MSQERRLELVHALEAIARALDSELEEVLEEKSLLAIILSFRAQVSCLVASEITYNLTRKGR